MKIFTAGLLIFYACKFRLKKFAVFLHLLIFCNRLWRNGFKDDSVVGFSLLAGVCWLSKENHYICRGFSKFAQSSSQK